MKIRSALVCPVFFLNYLTVKDGTDSFPETSVRNYHFTLCKIPGERRSSVGSYKLLKYDYIHRLSQNKILPKCSPLVAIISKKNLICFCVTLRFLVLELNEEKSCLEKKPRVLQKNHLSLFNKGAKRVGVVRSSLS